MTRLTSIAEYPTSLHAGRIAKQAMFQHAVVQMASGAIRRTQLWQYPQHTFTVDYDVVDLTYLWDQLLGFYQGVQGGLRSFLFQDWYNPNPTNEVLGIGDGSRTTFKIYGDQFDGVTVYVNGLTVAPSAIAPTTGFITLTSAPASGAIVTADVVNEKFRCIFVPDAPFEADYLGGQAYRVRVRLVQTKTLS